MKKVTFYYVRHGETLFNVTGRAQGVCDSPLTEKGISQAYLAQKKLKDIHFDRAFSSPVSRAYDTCEIVLGTRNLSITKVKGLSEINFGTLEGATMSPELERCWRASDYTSVGGENEAQVLSRIQQTFQSLFDECEDGENVLVVSHRGYYIFMLTAILGMNHHQMEQDDPHFMEHVIPNASCAIITCEDGQFTLVQKPQ